MASTMSDDGLLAGGAVLLALVAVGVALVRDGGRRVFNIPSDFGQTQDTNADAGSQPEDRVSPTYPNAPGSREWRYEDPDDNPDSPENDTDLDFGTSDPGPPGSGSQSSGSTAGGTDGTPTQPWRF